MSEDIHTVKTVEEIMKYIPCHDEFVRMLEFAPDTFNMIGVPRPVFPYSQDDVSTMSLLEHKVTFTMYENRVESWRSANYVAFESWNRDCFCEMGKKELNHMMWLCRRISSEKLANMDVDSCTIWRSGCIHFDKYGRLVISNDR